MFHVGTNSQHLRIIFNPQPIRTSRMMLRYSRSSNSIKSLFISEIEKLKLRTHSIQLHRKIIGLHLNREYFFQVFIFSVAPHHHNSNDLIFIKTGVEERKTLYVIPVEVSKANINDLLFVPLTHKILT